MMRTKTNGNMLSLFYKPLCILFLLAGLFGLIWLRSSVVTANYAIRNLEEKKMEAVKDMKTLLAEREKFMSLEKVATSFRDNMQSEKVPAAGSNIFGDRVRVVHIKKNGEPRLYKASLEVRNKN